MLPIVGHHNITLSRGYLCRLLFAVLATLLLAVLWAIKWKWNEINQPINQSPKFV